MTQDNKYENGFGVIAAIAIVAVLAVGGFVTYRVVQNSQVQVEVEEQEQMDESEKTVAEVRADVVSTLNDVRSDLVLSAQASVDTAVLALTDLSARVDEAVLAVEGQARAELVALKLEVERLKARLQSRGGGSSASADVATESEIEAEFDSIIEDIQADLEADGGADVMVEDDSMTEDEDSTSEDDSSTEDEGSTEAEADGSAEVEAEATVESSY